MSLIPSNLESATPYHPMTLRCSVSAAGRLEYRGLPAIATGSPRSELIVSRDASELGRGTLWDTARGAQGDGELVKGPEGGSLLLCKGSLTAPRQEYPQSDDLVSNKMAQPA
jgi:hypothetical protein